MNLDDDTTVLSLIEQVRGLVNDGRPTMFVQPVMFAGEMNTIAVATGEAGELLRKIVMRLIEQKGARLDPRSMDVADQPPWRAGGSGADLHG